MKKLFTAITLLLLTILVAPPVQAQEGPPVLAFYYAWFDQNTWSSGQSVDLPVVPYTSSDPATIARHVAEARGAGIDALIQSWYGPQVENNQTETNFRLLLDQAAAQGMQAAVDVEVSGPFFPDAGAVSGALSTLLATHAQHPAYLRYQGKQVIFFWRQQAYPLETWQAIRDQIDPDRSTLWIAEGVDIDYQAVFDGHHLYSIAWAGSPAAELAKWGDRVRSYEAENGVDRLWVATTMPGYDDTRLPRADSFAVPRGEGAYYRETWQGAVDSGPDMIMITSFNEWLEGTQIEPSAAYGSSYLELTRELVTGLKGQAPPAPIPVPAPAEVAAAAPPAQEAEPIAQETPPPPDGPYINIIDITNVRPAPSTDTDIEGRLQPGTQVPVVGRLDDSSWWFVESDGLSGWVSAEVVEFVGDSAEVPVVEPESLDAPGGNQADALPPADDAPRPEVNIPAGGVNARSGPGLEFELLERLDEGASYPVIGQDETGGWWLLAVEAVGDEQVWVADAVVTVTGDVISLPVVLPAVPGATPTNTPTPTPTEPVIAGSIEGLDAINVRDEPAVDSNIIGGFYLGNTADVLAISEDGDWWQIDYAEAPGQPAWVAAEFVRFTGDKTRVPIFGVGTVTPTPGPTNTPTPTGTPTPRVVITEQPTLAPTATSIYQATSAAMLTEMGTPEANDQTTAADSGRSFGWGDIPWGILSILVIAGFLWYQFFWRRRLR
jgi:uncharacterized protein YgiM (DUF1202 family)